MEEKINIAEILNGKKNGLRLYSPIFGECTFCCVREDTNDICVKKHNGVKEFFDSKGLYSILGEVMIFPSKEMHDWEKFSWKRGDVLISDCGFVCIFKEWASDDYTRFNGCYFDGMPNAPTAKYSKLDNNTAYGYIRELEKRCGGVLNLKTLRIEKTNFKDGDILHSDETEYSDETIFIAKISGRVIGTYAYIDLFDECVMMRNDTFKKSEINAIRIATDSEKQQLFDALAKEGKAWDSEKKAIVDFKPKWITPKPFDRVITRKAYDDIWTANIFSHMNSCGEYVAIGCAGCYHYCLPYNDETAHLLGTTDEWKVGKG